jgi:Protein of unknown function (DUF2933)
MTVLAASGFAALIPILFALACPLMMIFMMRGMHGHGRSSGRDRRHEASLDELYRRRDVLEQEIADREQAAPQSAAPPQIDLTRGYSKEAR